MTSHPFLDAGGWWRAGDFKSGTALSDWCRIAGFRMERRVRPAGSVLPPGLLCSRELHPGNRQKGRRDYVSWYLGIMVYWYTWIDEMIR
jgi:hypothetical protein